MPSRPQSASAVSLYEIVSCSVAIRPEARSMVRMGMLRSANSSMTASQVRPKEAVTGVAILGVAGAGGVSWLQPISARSRVAARRGMVTSSRIHAALGVAHPGVASATSCLVPADLSSGVAKEGMAGAGHRQSRPCARLGAVRHRPPALSLAPDVTLYLRSER